MAVAAHEPLIIFLGGWPRTTTGEIDWTGLRAILWYYHNPTPVIEHQAS